MANAAIATLRKCALALSDSEEGTSCKKAAFKAGKKNFLFLSDSLPQAKNVAQNSPDTYSVGGDGWL